MFAKNLYLAGRTLARSAPIAKSLQTSFQFPVTKSVYSFENSQQLTLIRGFASDNKGKDHLKEGLPEQYQWTADHLEKYLRNFASKYGYKQSDVDHLIKTFVTGPTSAKDFFNLDRESLAAKIGKESPERTQMANQLVAEVWKETQAVGKQMQNYGSILIGVAAVLFGGWAYSHFSGSSDSKDSKKDTKGAPAKMSEEKKAAENRAADNKDHDKSGSGAKGNQSAPSNKDKKEAAQAFKADGAVGKEFTEKGAIGGAAQKVGGPLDKDGAVGKQFTKDGAIGGAVQKKAEQKEEEYKSKETKEDKKDKKN